MADVRVDGWVVSVEVVALLAVASPPPPVVARAAVSGEERRLTLHASARQEKAAPGAGTLFQEDS